MSKRLIDSCPKQLIAITAICTIFISLGLLIAGMVIAPAGQIHESVLIAYGEVSAFVCCLLGVNNKSLYTANRLATA